MKQLNLFEARSVPKGKRRPTRKRNTRLMPVVAKSVRPQLPTVAFFRSMAKRGQYVMEGLIEKPIPKTPQSTSSQGRTKKGKSVIHKKLAGQGGAVAPAEVWIDFPEIGYMNVSGWTKIFDMENPI